jgi:HSP20 family protein
MIKRIRPVVGVRRSVDEVRRFREDASPERPDFPELDGSWIPRLDLVETDTALIVAMEAPGLEAKDLVISIQPNRLEIKGWKKEAPAPAGLAYLRLEREYGPFRRKLILPRAVLTEGIRATLENGILTVILPKRPAPRAKRTIVRIIKPTE